MEDIKPLVTEELEFQYGDETLQIAFFGTWDCQCSNTWKTIGESSLEKTFTSKKFLMQTMIEEIKPVVMGFK